MSDAVVGVFKAVLAKISVPEATPPVAGENITLNAAPWPAGMVIGNEAPEIVNRALLLEADMIVTSLPTALMLKDPIAWEPTFTLPKFI